MSLYLLTFPASLIPMKQAKDNGVDNLIQCDIMRTTFLEMALNYIKNNHYDLANEASH